MADTFGLIALSTPLTTLVLYALWALALVLGVVGWRGLMVFKDGTDPATFPSGQKHGPDTYWRLNRAHANAVENLPIFGAIVVASAITGHSTGTFATLCVVVLCARIVQSVLHVSSNHTMVVNMRFASLLVQVFCLVWMGLILL
ncbi:MAG: MAPEG family protein [Alphaproteobacteria bacterium]